MRTTITFLICTLILYSCNSNNGKPDIKKGETLFQSTGCSFCHSLTGEARYGPTLNTIFNSNVEVIRKGETITLKADRDFIRRSIQDPDFEREINFKDHKMPKPALNSVEIESIIEYIVSINAKQ